MSVFILLIFFPSHILFLFFLSPSLHTLSSSPFVVIDGVRQQYTEQRVANSPRQPAWEGKREVGEEEEGGGD